MRGSKERSHECAVQLVYFWGLGFLFLILTWCLRRVLSTWRTSEWDSECTLQKKGRKWKNSSKRFLHMPLLCAGASIERLGRA